MQRDDELIRGWRWHASTKGWTSNGNRSAMAENSLRPLHLYLARNPRLLIVDGHCSHLTVSFVEYCMNHSTVVARNILTLNSIWLSVFKYFSAVGGVRLGRLWLRRLISAKNGPVLASALAPPFSHVDCERWQLISEPHASPTLLYSCIAFFRG